MFKTIRLAPLPSCRRVEGTIEIDIRGIGSPHKMISYIMIFVHNDRLRTLQIDIQMCAY